jgi:hypothetical protein
MEAVCLVVEKEAKNRGKQIFAMFFLKSFQECSTAVKYKSSAYYNQVGYRFIVEI